MPAGRDWKTDANPCAVRKRATSRLRPPERQITTVSSFGSSSLNRSADLTPWDVHEARWNGASCVSQSSRTSNNVIRSTRGRRRARTLRGYISLIIKYESLRVRWRWSKLYHGLEQTLANPIRCRLRAANQDSVHHLAPLRRRRIDGPPTRNAFFEPRIIDRREPLTAMTLYSPQ